MYDYDSNVDYQAVGTKVRTWTSGDKRYTETSYFDVARKIHVNYQGIPVDASIAMEDGIMDLMEPYDYAELIKHDNKFLSGFEAETYNMPPDQLASRAQEKLTRRTGAGYVSIPAVMTRSQARDSQATTGRPEQSLHSCRYGCMSTDFRIRTISST